MHALREMEMLARTVLRNAISKLNQRAQVGEECMPKYLRSLWWLVILGISLVGQAFGQGGATGAITGTVLDQSGAVVANADIRIINQDTGTVARVTKTDPTGSFTATLLPVATYTVDISSGGFREAKIPDVAVRVTETTRMTAKLVPLQVL